MPKEGQMGHDDRFGYGILNARDLWVARRQPRSAHIVIEEPGYDPIITSRVAPDGSQKRI